ncbi:hypothetical protein BDW22DRAFT_1428204 [Trametopsis cervina]|nr:hypothetical protein BDW22DRAFT_1428204 [Trametopsis cervina]
MSRFIGIASLLALATALVAVAEPVNRFHAIVLDAEEVAETKPAVNSCADECTWVAAGAAGCSGMDLHCACTSPSFQAAFRQCVQETCSFADAGEGVAFFADACEARADAHTHPRRAFPPTITITATDLPSSPPKSAPTPSNIPTTSPSTGLGTVHTSPTSFGTDGSGTIKPTTLPSTATSFPPGPASNPPPSHPASNSNSGPDSGAGTVKPTTIPSTATSFPPGPATNAGTGSSIPLNLSSTPLPPSIPISPPPPNPVAALSSSSSEPAASGLLASPSVSGAGATFTAGGLSVNPSATAPAIVVHNETAPIGNGAVGGLRVGGKGKAVWMGVVSVVVAVVVVGGL